ALDEAEPTRGPPLREILATFLHAAARRLPQSAARNALQAIQSKDYPVYILKKTSDLPRELVRDADIEDLGVFFFQGAVYITEKAFKQLSSAEAAAVILHEALESCGYAHAEAAGLVRQVTGYTHQRLVARAGVQSTVTVGGPDGWITRAHELLAAGRSGDARFAVEQVMDLMQGKQLRRLTPGDTAKLQGVLEGLQAETCLSPAMQAWLQGLQKKIPFMDLYARLQLLQDLEKTQTQVFREKGRELFQQAKELWLPQAQAKKAMEKPPQIIGSRYRILDFVSERGVAAAYKVYDQLTKKETALRYSGLVVKDRYELKERISFGGYAEIYSAYDRKTRQNVAVKIASSNLGSMMILKEIQVSARLANFSAAAQLADYGWFGLQAGDGRQEYVFTVMEKGGENSFALLETKDLAPDRFLAFTRNLLGAFAGLHAQDLLGIDIRPENILLAASYDGQGNLVFHSDQIKLIDFAWAFPVAREGLVQVQPGVLNAEWLAPEAKSAGIFSVQSDLYSLGAVLNKILENNPQLQDLPGIQSCLARLTAQKAEDRYLSAQEALRELNDAQAAALEQTCSQLAKQKPALLPLAQAEWLYKQLQALSGSAYLTPHLRLWLASLQQGHPLAEVYARLDNLDRAAGLEEKDFRAEAQKLYQQAKEQWLPQASAQKITQLQQPLGRGRFQIKDYASQTFLTDVFNAYDKVQGHSVKVHIANRLIAGRYELQERIDTGGYASVFRAYDRQTRRWVALKTAPAQRDYLILLKEILLLSRLRGVRGQVQLLDAGWWQLPGSEEEYVFAVLEEEAVNALELVDHGTLTPDQFFAYAKNLLEAFAALHAAGILQIDVRLQNVMLDMHYAGFKKLEYRSDRVTLLDFGLAMPMPPDGTVRLKQNLENTNWLAPESQSQGLFTVRTDLYSAGIVLQSLLQKTPGLREDPGIQAFINQLQAEKPEDRFATAPKALQALTGVKDISLSLLETVPQTKAPFTGESRKNISAMGTAVVAILAIIIEAVAILGLVAGYSGLTGHLSLGLGWALASLLAGLLGAITMPVIAIPFLALGTMIVWSRFKARGQKLTDARRARLLPEWLEAGMVDAGSLPENLRPPGIAHYLDRNTAAAQLQGKIVADLARISYLPRFMQRLILLHELAHRRHDDLRAQKGRAPPNRLWAEIYAYGYQVQYLVLQPFRLAGRRLLARFAKQQAAPSAPARPHAKKLQPTAPALPAGHLLTALGLDDPTRLQGAEVLEEFPGPGGLTIRRIYLNDMHEITRARPPQQLDILRTELGNVAYFELLYNAEGRLIAVFPLPILTSETRFHYFDFSDFYFSVPAWGDGQARDKWRRFVEQRNSDKAAIEEYKNSGLNVIADMATAVNGERSPYFFARIDPETQAWTCTEFNPDSGQLSELEQAPGRCIILPVFPTVYSPANKTHDAKYYQILARRLEVRPKQKVLVVGPGSGIDSWVAYLKGARKIQAVGINPLELANLRATAQIAGFEVEGVVHDNILTLDGQPVIANQGFDWIIWNMPWFFDAPVPSSQDGHPGFHAFWDGDLGASVLKRFASGLVKMLVPGGRSIIWNGQHDRQERGDLIQKILAKGGLEHGPPFLHVKYEGGEVYWLQKPAVIFGPDISEAMQKKLVTALHQGGILRHALAQALAGPEQIASIASAVRVDYVASGLFKHAYLAQIDVTLKNGQQQTVQIICKAPRPIIGIVALWQPRFWRQWLAGHPHLPAFDLVRTGIIAEEYISGTRLDEVQAQEKINGVPAARLAVGTYLRVLDYLQQRTGRPWFIFDPKPENIIQPGEPETPAKLVDRDGLLPIFVSNPPYRQLVYFSAFYGMKRLRLTRMWHGVLAPLIYFLAPLAAFFVHPSREIFDGVMDALGPVRGRVYLERAQKNLFSIFSRTSSFNRSLARYLREEINSYQETGPMPAFAVAQPALPEDLPTGATVLSPARPGMSFANAVLSGAVYSVLLLLTGTWLLPVLSGVVFGAQIGLIIAIWARYYKSQGRPLTVREFVRWLKDSRGGRVADLKEADVYSQYRRDASHFTRLWFKGHEILEKYLPFRFIPLIGPPLNHLIVSATDPLSGLAALLLWGRDVLRAAKMRQAAADHIGVSITADAQETAERAAAHFALRIRRIIAEKGQAVIGLATGSTPEGMYRLLREHPERYGIDWEKVHTFNLDEYIGLPATHAQSYRHYMEEQLFRHVPIPRENIHFLNGLASDLAAEARMYEEEILRAGGIDLQLLGIGENGHLAFNEPGSLFTSRTRAVALARSTIRANSRFFTSPREVPRKALTMGLATILASREILVLATGSQKAGALSRALEYSVSEKTPASALQLHENAFVIADQAAAQELSFEPQEKEPVRARQEIARIESILAPLRSVYGAKEEVMKGLLTLANLDIRTLAARHYLMGELLVMDQRDSGYMLAYISSEKEKYELSNAAFMLLAHLNSPEAFYPEYEGMTPDRFDAMVQRLVQEHGLRLGRSQLRELEKLKQAISAVPRAFAKLAQDPHYPHLCGPAAEILQGLLRQQGLPAQKVIVQMDFERHVCVTVNAAGLRFYLDGTGGRVLRYGGEVIAPIVVPALDISTRPQQVPQYLKSKEEITNFYFSPVEIEKPWADFLQQMRETLLAAQNRAGWINTATLRRQADLLKHDHASLAYETHVAVFAASGSDQVVKVRNTVKDINYSFDMYRRLEGLPVRGLARAHYLRNVEMKVRGEVRRYDEAVVQDRAVMLDALLNEAAAAGRWDEARGLLRAWADLHLDLFSQGLTDKLFTITDRDQPRKFWMNVGRTPDGQWVHVDHADLTDKPVSLAGIRQALPQVVRSFALLYEGEGKDILLAYLQDELVPYLDEKFRQTEWVRRADVKPALEQPGLAQPEKERRAWLRYTLLILSVLGVISGYTLVKGWVQNRFAAPASEQLPPAIALDWFSPAELSRGVATLYGEGYKVTASEEIREGEVARITVGKNGVSQYAYIHRHGRNSAMLGNALQTLAGIPAFRQEPLSEEGVLSQDAGVTVSMFDNAMALLVEQAESDSGRLAVLEAFSRALGVQIGRLLASHLLLAYADGNAENVVLPHMGPLVRMVESGDYNAAFAYLQELTRTHSVQLVNIDFDPKFCYSNEPWSRWNSNAKYRLLSRFGQWISEDLIRQGFTDALDQARSRAHEIESLVAAFPGENLPQPAALEGRMLQRLTEDDGETFLQSMLSGLPLQGKPRVRGQGQAGSTPITELELSFWEKYLPWIPKPLRPFGEELIFRVLPMLLFHLGYATPLVAGLLLAAFSALFLILHKDRQWTRGKWIMAVLVTVSIALVYFSASYGLSHMNHPASGGLLAYLLASAMHSVNNTLARRYPDSVWAELSLLRTRSLPREKIASRPDSDTASHWDKWQKDFLAQCELTPVAPTDENGRALYWAMFELGKLQFDYGLSSLGEPLQLIQQHIGYDSLQTPKARICLFKASDEFTDRLISRFNFREVMFIDPQTPVVYIDRDFWEQAVLRKGQAQPKRRT
ncbi:glucosamine-6-phosphate deaminase, partial [candidate division FCPU426 bacterium]|nr:glucosamine-6-phosphate deaminase [candidate division FCPU426 bacterium]